MVEGELAGDPEQLVTGLAGIREAAPGDVSFVASPKYRAAVKTTHASVLIVARDLEVTFSGTLVRVENPSDAFARLVGQVAPRPIAGAAGVNAPRRIAPSECHAAPNWVSMKLLAGNWYSGILTPSGTVARKTVTIP